MSASVVLWGEVASLAHATPVVPTEPYDHLVSQDITCTSSLDAPKLWMNWWLPHFPASGVATALSPTRTWTDMHWHPDGSFVYLTNSASPTSSTSELVKYTASTPWTASTLSLTWTRGAKKSLYNLANPAVVPPPTAMTADVTGNKIFLAFQNLDADGDGDSDNIAIHQYDVSDMSTIEASFPFSEAAGTIHSMKWRADGERLFISQNSYVKQYRATTPWDITELTFETQIQATSGTDNDIVWKPTGEKLYVVQGTSISSYVPSPAFNVWNLPTMSLVNTKTGMSSGSRLAWKSDGTRFFQLSGSSIKQHDFTGI